MQKVTPEKPYQLSELVAYYSSTFNAPTYAANPYPKMMINYNEIFKEDEKAIQVHIMNKAEQ